MRYIVKIYLFSLLVFAFIGCSDNEKKPKAILGVLGLGKTTSSSNAVENPLKKPESETAVVNPVIPTNPAPQAAAPASPESEAAIANSTNQLINK